MTKKTKTKQTMSETTIKKETETETPESLRAKIKYANDKIKRLEQKLDELNATCTDTTSLYYKADVAMVKSDISNCKATIFLCNEKLKRLEKEEAQPGQ